jgi:hypothetical protein
MLDVLVDLFAFLHRFSHDGSDVCIQAFDARDEAFNLCRIKAVAMSRRRNGVSMLLNLVLTSLGAAHCLLLS